ncbi:unnamed protein product [Staurois parvus]|uniref:Secreted protein n=1 Tax=Staurois parvus TaxID=386267 RepID=A0ABN9CNV7_9NEOB|nr:unnamed protein product [Staurois parvus]
MYTVQCTCTLIIRALISLQQCHLSVPYQCHTYQCLPVHFNATYQCPSELPFSATYQCQSVPPINAMPVSAT